jgi:hypothetical protein
VTAHSFYGLLHYINGTGKAFAELESAIQFAEENPSLSGRVSRLLGPVEAAHPELPQHIASETKSCWSKSTISEPGLWRRG